MLGETKRERIVRLIREMRKHTVGQGCTPPEAAAFAAKAAELVERFQIEEEELRAGGAAQEESAEICQNTLRTGKRVFNPGMSAVIAALAGGMCCRCILLHQGGEAVYGVVGDSLDADYVLSIATSVVPALTVMAKLEGAEHGEEKAGLVRWTNNYLIGAATEIRKRLETNRKARSAAKEAEALVGPCTALAVVTGETIAVTKRAASEAAFREMYPNTRATYSRARYDGTARDRGREAGKTVGLNVQIG